MTTSMHDAVGTAPMITVAPGLDASDLLSRESSGPPAEAEPIGFVTPDGDLTELGLRSGLDVPLACVLYRDMARARRLDREAFSLQRQGELGLWLQSWGQEGAQVGSMRALQDGDWVFPSYREHAAAMVRGITPTELLSQWRGATHGGWDPASYRFHIYSLVLGTQTLHAAGYAMGIRLDGAGDIVMAYFGDGAASQGDVNEAFNWAATRRLPVLFFCQNNQWAISTPTDLQYGSPLHQRAAGFGLRSFHVDGNDVLAVHAVTSAAAEFVRSGAGPAFIEAATYRMAGHSTSDDPGRYRDADDVAAWEARDPITRLRTVLEGAGVPPAFFRQLDGELDELAAEVRDACRSIAAPDLDAMFDLAYATSHPTAARERADRRRYLDNMPDA